MNVFGKLILHNALYLNTMFFINGSKECFTVSAYAFNYSKSLYIFKHL